MHVSLGNGVGIFWPRCISIILIIDLINETALSIIRNTAGPESLEDFYQQVQVFFIHIIQLSLFSSEYLPFYQLYAIFTTEKRQLNYVNKKYN